MQKAYKLGIQNTYSSTNTNSDIFKKLCPHYTLCQASVLYVPRYMLNELDLMQNIIKITEKPCAYVKDIIDIEDSSNIEYDYFS